MTPELPVNDRDSAQEPHEPDAAGMAPMATGKSTQPPGGSSGKHPLPSPWPQRGVSQPIVRSHDAPAIPDTVPDDAPALPSVTPEHWLPEPDYWMADHQRIPRPPTRPLARPRRFRQMSRMQSLMLAGAILLIVLLIGVGMVVAGHKSYEFFNAPRPIPTLHPANATPTLPAKQP